MNNFLGKKLCPPKKPRRPIRKLGRLGKLRAKGKRDAGKFYESKFGRVCQSHGGEVSSLDRHHKLPCSKGGKENPENLVCICRCCHLFIHQPGFSERVHHVGAQEANVENGKQIEWAHHTNALTKWRLAWQS